MCRCLTQCMDGLGALALLHELPSPLPGCMGPLPCVSLVPMSVWPFLLVTMSGRGPLLAQLCPVAGTMGQLHVGLSFLGKRQALPRHPLELWGPASSRAAGPLLDLSGSIGQFVRSF